MWKKFFWLTGHISMWVFLVVSNFWAYAATSDLVRITHQFRTYSPPLVDPAGVSYDRELLVFPSALKSAQVSPDLGILFRPVGVSDLWPLLSMLLFCGYVFYLLRWKNALVRLNVANLVFMLVWGYVFVTAVSLLFR